MSVRIFGSGGGVITDATATPEDVVSGQVFYNNDGRQTGTNEIKRTKTQIYVCDKGIHTSLGLMSTARLITSTYIRQATHNNDIHVVNFTNMGINTSEYTLRSPTSSSAGTTYNPFFSISNLQISLSNINYIKIGAWKFIMANTTLGTSSSSSLPSQYIIECSVSSANWTINNEPVSSVDLAERVYLVVSTQIISGIHYITGIILVNRCTNYASRYSTAVYTDNIPIAVSTYVE